MKVEEHFHFGVNAYFSIGTAAKEIGTFENSIRQKVKRNTIPHTLINNRPFIPENIVLYEKCKKSKRHNIPVVEISFFRIEYEGGKVICLPTLENFESKNTKSIWLVKEYAYSNSVVLEKIKNSTTGIFKTVTMKSKDLLRIQYSREILDFKNALVNCYTEIYAIEMYKNTYEIEALSTSGEHYHFLLKKNDWIKFKEDFFIDPNQAIINATYLAKPEKNGFKSYVPLDT